METLGIRTEGKLNRDSLRDLRIDNNLKKDSLRDSGILG
jgi:hypothetical protein